MKTLKYAGVVAVLVGLAGIGLGEDPDPTAILKKANETTHSVKAISYKVRVWGEDGAEGAIPKMAGKVLARTGDKHALMMRIKLEITQPGSEKPDKVLFVTDGKKVLRRDKAADAPRISSFPGAGGIAQDQTIGAAWMQEYLYPTPPFKDELEGKSEYEGTKKIGDTECHVIHVDYANGSESRWFFGIKDNLPHRVDRIGGFGSRVTELTNIKTSPKISADAFKITEESEKKPKKADG